jgi:8-oxo-dGTP diphosphatase
MAIWQVIRLDDNGNRYDMAERDSQDEAQQIVDDVIARGHKQAYWIEQIAKDEQGDAAAGSSRFG